MRAILLLLVIKFDVMVSDRGSLVGQANGPFSQKSSVRVLSEVYIFILYILHLIVIKELITPKRFIKNKNTLCV